MARHHRIHTHANDDIELEPCALDLCAREHDNVFTDGELDDIARSIVGLFFGSHTDIVQSRALAAVHRRFRGAAPDASVDGV